MTAAEARRVWIVSELYYPEETSTGHVMTSIAEHLATRGWQVGALSVQPTYSRRGVRAPKSEVHNGVQIRRLWSTTFDKNGITGRVLNGLTTSFAIAFAALRRCRKGDVAFVVTNPPLLPFLTLLACRVRGARCALLVHDVHPEQMIAFGMVRAGSPLVRIVQAMMRWLYRRLDHIIVIGRDMAEVVRQKAQRPDLPITVATNWSDELSVRPRQKTQSAMLERLGWTDCFVVQYAGNMGRPNAIELIVDAATLLRDHPRLRFLFVGAGAKLPWLREQVASRRLTSIAIEPPVPREQQTELLGACDVSIVPLIPGMLGLGVPSRTYNVLAAGRPLIAIAHPQSEVARLIDEEKIGWVVPDTAAPEALARVLSEAANAPAEHLACLGQRSRAAAESKYARGVILDRIAAVLEQTRTSR